MKNVIHNYLYIKIYEGFPGGSDGKESASMWDTQVRSLSQEDPLEKEWLPTPVFLTGEFHGQRSLAGHSPCGCKESDMTEQLTLSIHFHDSPQWELLPQVEVSSLHIEMVFLERCTGIHIG